MSSPPTNLTVAIAWSVGSLGVWLLARGFMPAPAALLGMLPVGVRAFALL